MSLEGIDISMQNELFDQGKVPSKTADKDREKISKQYGGKILFFDVETQKSAEEVGGWRNVSVMRVALAVTCDSKIGEYRTYFEKDVDKLIIDLLTADLVIGFNIDRFDIEVLRGYTTSDLSKIKTFDILRVIYKKLGFRIGLGHLAEATLGESKIADGFQSLRWFKEGRLDLIEEYCRKDVEITKRLFDYGREKGYLLYRDYNNNLVKLAVDW